MAAISAAITHNHPEGIKGAQATAAAIFLARNGKTKDEIRDYVEKTYGYDLHKTWEYWHPIYHWEDSCQGTVPQAMIAFLDSTDFEDAIRKAVSLGGDSDTLACITGGIAEAFYREIPKEMADRVRTLLPQEFADILSEMQARTPYGTIYSAFMSEDDLAMKKYFARKESFAKFMASGVSTNTKSYDPGYRGFLFWNLTKNSPVIRMGGISYIPKDLEDKYTYEIHYKYLSSLMLQCETNVMNALDYTREKLILDYMNKCVVHSLDICYDVAGYKFTIRSSFDMMMDPDSGDIILKLQNDSIKTTKK